jgi:ATP-dependent exoDNAse (exonuclease V) beta subunit
VFDPAYDIIKVMTLHVSKGLDAHRKDRLLP